MRRLLRLLTIVWVICRYRLDEFVPVTILPLPLRLLLLFAPWHWFPKPPLSRGERLRKALEKLGPIFVKFGQILSTRRDLLPEELADELKKLQDKVPPFAGSEAVAIVETALKAPVDDIFASFTEEPMASASVAQVHAAKLNSGEDVVVKVIRPNIENTIRIDIALMLIVARMVELYWKEGKRLHPVAVVKDYENTIIDELDLQREAANTSQLKRNFINSSLIYIPDIYWDYTTTNVLVMERIYGIPVAEIGQLQDAGVDLKLLAERGVEIFFTQVFRDSFFHADMHPGNIFVDAENPDDPRYIAIDCGIVGSLDQDDQNYLARNLLAFFNRDYHQVAALHVSSGWVSADTHICQFEAAIRTVCEPIFEKPLKDISFGQFLVRLFQTARRFDMEVQPQLVLLQKTLLNIEGLGRQLYPDLDLWSTAHPYLERWMRERIAPPNVLKTFHDQLPQWLAQSPEIPGLLFDAANRLRHQHQHKEQYHQSLKQMLQTEKRQRRDFFWGTIAVTLALVMVVQKAPVQILPTQDWSIWGLGLLGFYLWIRPK